ncbi:MAG: hypothetical protein QM652_11235 [Legionella sp.]|uniref:hypothetical protein n=1 Tax=Legionella sp. TaxID=459 RepID=UPI0039E510B0
MRNLLRGLLAELSLKKEDASKFGMNWGVLHASRREALLTALLQQWSGLNAYFKRLSVEEVTIQLAELNKELLKLVVNSPLHCGDVQVLTHYLSCKWTPFEKPIAFSLEQLWPAGIDAKARYQEHMSVFLHEDFALNKGSLIESPNNFAVFKMRLDFFKRLRRLYLVSAVPEAESSKDSPTLLIRMQNILVALMDWLRTVFGSRVMVNDTRYCDVADALWVLLQEFDLASSHPEALTALSDWYERGRAYYADRPYVHKKGIEAIEHKTSTRPWEGMERKIDKVVQRLDKELTQVAQWNAYDGRVELMRLLPTPSKASEYLVLYQRMEARFTQWSQYAWRIRQHYERVLRQDTNNYLFLLQTFDDALLKLEEKMQVAKKKWRQSMNQFGSNDVFFQQANALLCRLENQCVRRLKYAHWVHQTAYVPGETEHALAYEMNQRNKHQNHEYFANYDLKQALTVSDYAVGQLEGAWREIKQRVLPAIHPDKGVSTDKEEQVIREYCMQQMDSWKKEAKRIREIWAQGQWQAQSPSLPLLKIQGSAEAENKEAEVVFVPAVRQERLGITEEEKNEELNIVLPPQAPLDLSSLVLHEEYVKNLKQAQTPAERNRRKEPTACVSTKKLYAGNAQGREAFDRWLFYEEMMARKLKQQLDELAKTQEQLNKMHEQFQEETQRTDNANEQLNNANIKLSEAVKEKEEAVKEKEEAVKGKEEAVKGKEEAVKGKEAAVKGKEQEKQRADEAEIKLHVSMSRMITMFLPGQLGSASFRNIPERRKEFDRRCNALVQDVKQVFSTLSGVAIENELQKQLREKEYAHLSDLVGVSLGGNLYSMYGASSSFASAAQASSASNNNNHRV